MNFITAIFVLVILIIISAIASSAEISLAGSRKIKLKQLGEQGDERAQKVLKLQESPGRFITIVQILLNMVAILAGIVGESALRIHIQEFLALYDLHYQWVQYASSLLSFLLVTVSFIVFADLIPKRFAMVEPEKVALNTVNIMLVLIWLFKPVVWILDVFSNSVLHLFRLPTSRQDHITSEDIYVVVNAAVAAGVINKQESYLIENIFDMQKRHVSSTMTTREYIIYLNIDDPYDEILKTLEENSHSKILVCKEDLESVVGYVESHNLLKELLHKESPISLTDPKILRNALFIPDTLSLYDVLERFKSTGEDFAIVINEYAIVVGVVTLKDVMSIVMGELVSNDEEQIIVRDENSWLIDGSTPVEDVLRVLDIQDFPEAENYETIAGFMMYLLKKIPKKTDFICYENYKFEVIDTDGFKIDQLLVSKIKK